MLQPNKNKKKKPIVVSDKNDPRYKAYQDSLNLYNYGNRNKKYVGDYLNGKLGEAPSQLLHKLDDNTRNSFKDIAYHEQVENKFNKIKPIHKTNIYASAQGIKNNLIFTLPFWKKPQQQVIVKDTRKPNTTTGKQVKESNGRGMVLNETFQKKPTQLIEIAVPRVKQTPISTIPLDIKPFNSNLSIQTTELTPIARIPKSYRVETQGGGKFGGWTRTEEVTDFDNISLDKGSKRTITPIYENGGKINTINIMKKPRLNSKKRYIAPAIIGAGVNMGMGLIQGAMQKNAAVKARSSALNQMWKEKSVSDAQDLVDYNTDGNYVDYYAGGGELPNKQNTTSIGEYQTKGGNLKPIGDGVAVAEGNKHSEKRIDNSYGITLYQQGEPIAEVEDEEVLVEQGDGTDMVYSEQLTDEKGVSFAKRMKQLTAKRNKLDKKLEGTKDSLSRNTIERQLAGLNMAEEVLTQKQEMAKMVVGQNELDNLAYGGKVKKYANGTSPDETIGEEESFNFMKELAPTLIDNVGNAALTAFSPKLPKPILTKAERINTNYNVNPQLAEVKGQTRAMVDNIYANTSNSNVARANVASTRLRGLEVTNNILGQKENIETGLRNQNIMNRQSINSKNVDTLNSNSLMEFTRANDIQSRISSNLADMSGDITETFERKDKTLRDAELMEIILSDDPTGARAKAMAKIDPRYNKYLKSTAEGKKYFRNKLNADVFGRANVGVNVFKDRLANNPFN